MLGFHALLPIEDNGGRRSELDRRSFFASGWFPEKRSRPDRRIGPDRRVRKEDFTNLMVSLEPKRKTDVYIERLRTRRMFFFCPLLSLSMWSIIILIALIFLRVI